MDRLTVMHKPHQITYVLVLVLLSLLTACGFQLRGSGGSSLPESWSNMHLASGNPNGELSREVQSTFSSNGVTWVDKQDADYTIKLGPEQFRQRNLSLNAAARAAEFELTLSANFAVSDAQGAEVMEVTTVSVIKQMENDPRNVVGKAEEVRILRSEMRSELVQQMIRRIGFFAASTQ